MFTGIITDIGTIEDIEARGDTRVRIASGYDMDGVAMGASIACSGVCLTVVDKGPGWFAVDVSGETRRRPRRAWTQGAAEPGTRAEGRRRAGRAYRHRPCRRVGHGGRRAPRRRFAAHRVRGAGALAGYLAPKGSITIDGVSLTVNEVSDVGGCACGSRSTSSRIPAAMTTLGTLAERSSVNLEIDVLARYLGRMEALRHVAQA
jgi:riboflavin synthase